MFKGLKHFFIPHEGNDFTPHFFREFFVSILIIGILVLFVASAGSSFILRNTELGGAVLPAVLADLTNQSRLENKENALMRNAVLDNVAQMKAQDMAAKGYFAHTSPEGLTPWYWFAKAGYQFIYAGENLAVNFSESNDVQNAWLASPTHRANILNDKFTEIGIATAEGVYNGTQTTFVVQSFGTPTPFTVPSAEVLPTTPKTTPSTKPKTTPTQVATASLSPAVAGEAVNANSNLETIVDTKEFAAVKNNAVPDNTVAATTPVPTHYSKWYERFLFNQPSYTGIIYRILVAIVFIALVLMIVIEFRRQHPKNIMYGVLILVILFVFHYINQTVFLPHFIF